MLIGAHVSTSGGIEQSLERAAAMDAASLQIFTQSPRMWRPTNHTPESVTAFRERRSGLGGPPVLCHALYFINLASPDPVILGKSIEALRRTTEVATAIGALGVVVHVGSHLGQGFETVLPRIVEAIRPALDELGDEQWILLEDSAGQGDTIGRDPLELGRIIEAVGHPRLGLCLDTCHLFVSGYDVGDGEEVARLVGDLDGHGILDRLRALHLNDSAMGLGTNRDRHALIGEGLIGERMAAFLGHPAMQGLPATIETYVGDRAKTEEERAEGGRASIAEFRRLHAAGLELYRP
jgi:deoxyribonuclease-4